MEDIVVFLGLRVFKTNNSKMFSGSRNEQVTSVEKSHFKMMQFLREPM